MELSLIGLPPVVALLARHAIVTQSFLPDIRLITDRLHYQPLFGEVTLRSPTTPTVQCHLKDEMDNILIRDGPLEK